MDYLFSNTLHLPTSKFFHCRIFVGNNRHIVRSTGESTKIKAKKVAEELYLEMKTNKEIGVPKNRTFKYFANELIKQEKQLSKGETRSERFSRDTQQVIHRDEKGLIAFFGNKDVSKITTNHIREFFINLDSDRPQPLSFSTKNKYLITLKKIFRVAYEFNVIDKIPLLPKIDVGRKNKDNPRPSFSEEEKFGINGSLVFEKFRNKILRSKFKLLNLLIELKQKKKIIFGVGAPSRATTLINFTGIDENIISYILEVKNSNKLNKYLPGTLIPVVDEIILDKTKPDYLLILSWHIKDELIKIFRKKGFKGKYIIPLPFPRIVN